MATPPPSADRLQLGKERGAFQEWWSILECSSSFLPFPSRCRAARPDSPAAVVDLFFGAHDYVSLLDFNGDGAINGTDLAQFRSRFAVILP